jgi:hypothetical protein
VGNESKRTQTIILIFKYERGCPKTKESGAITSMDRRNPQELLLSMDEHGGSRSLLDNPYPINEFY